VKFHGLTNFNSFWMWFNVVVMWTTSCYITCVFSNWHLATVVLLLNVQPFIPIIFFLLFHLYLSLNIQFYILFFSVSGSDHPSQLKALWNGEVIGEYEREHSHESNQFSVMVLVFLLNSQFHFLLHLYMTVSTTTLKTFTEYYDPRWLWKRTLKWISPV
jgi:hypothetical protein